ncbi:type II toxin-antitoxin system RelE/ParE family toxin [Desulfosporosinus sp. PR]|nr:type II toxin-antitoxin system RelE/ParE family toxin [Desulfosporosinus sp. PR]
MNKLRYSPEALKDLDEIWAYIYAELQNPDAA